MFSFTGKLNGVDKYNRIRVIVTPSSTIVKKINDINNPYKYINDETIECFIVIPKNKKQYLLEDEYNKNKNVLIYVTPKRYSFDGKIGTSLILKSFEFIDIV